MKSITTTLLTLVLIVAIGAGIAAVLQYEPAASPLPAASPSPAQNAPPAIPTSPLPDNWETYTNAQLGIALAHPPDVTIQDQPGSAAIVHIGPTQTEGTEIYDGYVLAFTREAFPAGSASLRDFAEQRVAADSQHGTIVSPLTPVSVNGLPGFTYTLEGLSRFDILILPSGASHALITTRLIADPGNLGYTGTVDSIFATLRLTSPQ